MCGAQVIVVEKKMRFSYFQCAAAAAASGTKNSITFFFFIAVRESTSIDVMRCWRCAVLRHNFWFDAEFFFYFGDRLMKSPAEWPQSANEMNI